MAHSAIHNLPSVVLDWLGELDLPEETRTTCASCPLGCSNEQVAADPYAFRDDTRCCTYHPVLTNWQAGRILEAGGQPAALLLARMEEREGVDAECIRAPKDHLDLRLKLGIDGFGRSWEARCPFWVGGELSCGIWEHRDAVCRTWHCRTTDGSRSKRLWWRVKKLLQGVENFLQLYCMTHGEPPADDAPTEAFVAWYRWCAQQVDALTVADIDHPDLGDLRALVEEQRAVVNQPLPPLLGAAVREIVPNEDGFQMRGDSRWDPVQVPQGIFQFLGRLDGNTTWTDALELANAALPEPISAGLIEDMYRRGVLRPLSGPKDLEAGQALQVRLGGEVMGQES